MSAARRISRPALGVTAALVLAAAVSSLVLVLTGQSPVDAAKGLWDGALGNRQSTLATLAQTTPLLLVALSFAFAFRAGIFNAGGQGQFIIGAFFASVVGAAGPFRGLPAAVHIPLMVTAACLGGALWALPPILLKAYLGTNEILTTLMFSYIAALLNDYLVQSVFRAPNIQPGTNAQTPLIAGSAKLPVLFAGSQVTLLLPVAAGLALAVWAFYRRTVLGYELNVFGRAPAVARAAGIATRRSMMIAMLVSGALAGLAGAEVVGGTFFADITPFTTDVGFNGILAALLVGNVPVLIPFSAFFFGAIQQGGLGLQIFTPVSQYIAGILMATIIVFASARRVPRIPRPAGFALRRESAR
jgi:general nucleoside transport system permease protein